MLVYLRKRTVISDGTVEYERNIILYTSVNNSVLNVFSFYKGLMEP